MPRHPPSSTRPRVLIMKVTSTMRLTTTEMMVAVRSPSTERLRMALTRAVTEIPTLASRERQRSTSMVTSTLAQRLMQAPRAEKTMTRMEPIKFEITVISRRPKMMSRGEVVREPICSTATPMTAVSSVVISVTTSMVMLAEVR